MRLGGPVSAGDTPQDWVKAHQAAGYSAAGWPLRPDATDEQVEAYVAAAAEADLVIAEVGAWSNPISPVEAVRQGSLELCKAALATADRIGARCCVNIAGSRAPQQPDRLTATGWDTHHAENFTEETFELIVQSIREIIDAVRPTRTFYTLETMPWMVPDSADSYLDVIEAVDREQFAVHLDPVNLVCTPRRYYGNAALLRECFQKLGPYIRSCHAKDIRLDHKFMVHLSELRPGAGELDYGTYLTEAAMLDADLPILLEHLPDAEQYRLGAEHIRSVARQVGVALK